MDSKTTYSRTRSVSWGRERETIAREGPKPRELTWDDGGSGHAPYRPGFYGKKPHYQTTMASHKRFTRLADKVKKIKKSETVLRFERVTGIEALAKSNGEWPRCEGCDRPIDLVGMMGRHKVCMDCVNARMRSVTKYRGACKCGRKAKLGETRSNGSRSWKSCRRCLGQVQQPDQPRIKRSRDTEEHLARLDRDAGALYDHMKHDHGEQSPTSYDQEGNGGFLLRSAKHWTRHPD